MSRSFFALLVALFLSSRAMAWQDSRLSMPIVVDGRTIPYTEFAIYLMPGQEFDVRYADAVEAGQISFGGTNGHVGEVQLYAPETPGLRKLTVINNSGNEQATLNVFTMIPSVRIGADGHLNGYRVGRYPLQPLRGLDIYSRPPGFVEVTTENASTRLSPNFTLGQFVSKQSQGYPKYVVLRANLLLKLENILSTLNRKGHPTNGLVIMSGFRTPWYNKQIGNVPYSRHVWGGAADIYIDDAPRDGRMDDLNRDGSVNRKDAQWLADFIADMSARGEFGSRKGGIGIYGSNSAHGPFVHVDVRGSLARW